MRIVLLVAFFFGLSGFQSIKYVKTKVNDDITLKLPEEFTLMTQQELNSKYVTSRTPVAAYTDFSKTVDLGVNIAYSRWNAEDLEIMQSFYKSNIMGLYDEVQFISEGIEEINGREYAVFEFESVVRDTEGTTITSSAISKFVRIQYTIVKSKTVLFTFACPSRTKDQWAPVAREILQSVKISKTL
jgi:hypothetical protein